MIADYFKFYNLTNRRLFIWRIVYPFCTAYAEKGHFDVVLVVCRVRGLIQAAGGIRKL